MSKIISLIPFISLLFASSNNDFNTEEILGIIFGTIFIVIFLYIFFYIYFIPSRIAYKKKKNNRFVILLINILFPGLGWLVALAFAMSENESQTKD